MGMLGHGDIQSKDWTEMSKTHVSKNSQIIRAIPTDHLQSDAQEQRLTFVEVNPGSFASQKVLHLPTESRTSNNNHISAKANDGHNRSTF